jgi:hypothetical protein
MSLRARDGSIVVTFSASIVSKGNFMGDMPRIVSVSCAFACPNVRVIFSEACCNASIMWYVQVCSSYCKLRR